MNGSDLLSEGALGNSGPELGMGAQLEQIPIPPLFYSCYFSLSSASFISVVPTLCLNHWGKIRSQISFAGSKFLLKVRLFLLSWGNWEHIANPHILGWRWSRQDSKLQFLAFLFEELRNCSKKPKVQHEFHAVCSFSFSKGSCTGMEIICVWFFFPCSPKGSNRQQAKQICL